MLSEKFFFTLKLIIGITIAFLFLHRCIMFIDPDMGWHLRAGEWIVTHQQIPHEDLFSYTLSNHEWIAHEWLLEAVFYTMAVLGMWWLLIILFFFFAFVPIAVWLFRAQSVLSLFLITLAGVIMHSIVGVRPQVLSFFLFFLCYEFILKQTDAKHRQKILLVAPLFFLLWANVHASFPAGLILFGCSIVGTILHHYSEKKSLYNRLFLAEVTSFSFSVIATLFNPYGLALWYEVISGTLTPINKYIIEWQYALPVWPIGLPAFLALSIGTIFLFRKKFSIAQHVAFGFFLLFAIRRARIIMQFFAIAVDMAVSAADRFMETAHANKDKEVKRTIGMIEGFLVGAIVFALAMQISSREVVDTYRPDFDAPQMLERACAHFACGNTFNDFNLGGAQILINPDRGVFAAGYMPHWTDNEGWSPTKEGMLRLRTETTHEEDIEYYMKLFQRYNVSSVMIARPAVISLPHMPQWMMNMYMPFVLGGAPQKNLITILEDADWCTIYQNDQSVIMLSPINCPHQTVFGSTDSLQQEVPR